MICTCWTWYACQNENYLTETLIERRKEKGAFKHNACLFCLGRKLSKLSTSGILSGLDALREEGILCDIELEVAGNRLSAHRVILAALSPYFKTLFTGAFKEQNERVVEIKGIEFNGLQKIVNCCYTARLDIDTKMWLIFLLQLTFFSLQR